MMQQMLGMQEEEEDEDSDEDGAAKANGKEPGKSDAEEKKEKAISFFVLVFYSRERAI